MYSIHMCISLSAAGSIYIFILYHPTCPSFLHFQDVLCLEAKKEKLKFKVHSWPSKQICLFPARSRLRLYFIMCNVNTVLLCCGQVGQPVSQVFVSLGSCHLSNPDPHLQDDPDPGKSRQVQICEFFWLKCIFLFLFYDFILWCISV